MTHTIPIPNFNAPGTDPSKWAVITHERVVTEPTVEESVLRLELSMTSGANWHGELRYAPFPVTVGETYTLSFCARARRPFAFSVWLGQQTPPYNSLVSEENHFGEKRMTSEWQTFTHTWKPIVSEEAARLNFVFGQIDNLVEVKDVELGKS